MTIPGGKQIKLKKKNRFAEEEQLQKSNNPFAQAVKFKVDSEPTISEADIKSNVNLAANDKGAAMKVSKPDSASHLPESTIPEAAVKWNVNLAVDDKGVMKVP